MASPEMRRRTKENDGGQLDRSKLVGESGQEMRRRC
ncbi:uncharacterized protein G2W53_003314 [Senna tora]|uniref:Uncharacterized protein n=1 Tax=Senna tora TaxID=362788 RepID=A0A835CFM9_9FABA|nr:uncharacterized protein G2W53_003314 [Senna tora]